LDESIQDEDENFAFVRRRKIFFLFFNSIYLKKMKEIKILNGFVKYFLPNYGFMIENLILYGSLTINDNTVNRSNSIFLS
jgi:hypothetical protein